VCSRWRCASRSEILGTLYGVLRGKQRHADGAYLWWKGCAGCVIVSLTNSPNRTHYRVRPNAIRMARKMCACNTAQRSAFGLAHLGKGRFPAPLHPPARAFSPWTRPGRFHPPDPRPGGPSCPPWTPRPRETSLSLRPPIDQAFAAPQPARATALFGLTAPKGKPPWNPSSPPWSFAFHPSAVRL
jgi:hypothetical protein